MVRIVIILAIMAAGMPPAVLTGAAADSPSPAKCCCCPAGACHCGCDAPASPQPRDAQDEPSGLALCACDVSPLALPTPGPESDTRLTLSGMARVEPILADADISAPPFRGHQPHGPPSAVQMLSTVILLT